MLDITYDAFYQISMNMAAALHLDDSFWRIGYQCQFDKARSWLSSFTFTVLKELADAERIYVIALYFSIDCLETLYDIQQKMRDSWIELRGSQTDLHRDSFRCIPCLNDSDAHVEVLRHVILNDVYVSPLT